MSNIVYILVAQMEKDVQAKYQEYGPTQTLSENMHISDKTIHGHKCLFINWATRRSWLMVNADNTKSLPFGTK